VRVTSAVKARLATVALLLLALWPAATPASPVSRADASAPAVAVAQATVPVLMYHYVRVDTMPGDSAGFALSVTPQDFAAQMALLRAEGFHTVSLADVRRAWDGAPLPPRAVVLSFDDGDADFATAALPVLLRNGFTATAFVISDNVGRAGYMSAQQLAQVVAAGITVGSHTVDHPDLTTLPTSAVWWELRTARSDLQELTGQSVDDLAYPYGTWNAGVAEQAAQAGYADAVTVAPGAVLQSAQRYALPRVRVSGGESLAAFGQSVGVELAATAAPAPCGTWAVAADGGLVAAGGADGGVLTFGDARFAGAPLQPL